MSARVYTLRHVPQALPLPLCFFRCLLARRPFDRILVILPRLAGGLRASVTYLSPSSLKSACGSRNPSLAVRLCFEISSQCIPQLALATRGRRRAIARRYPLSTLFARAATRRRMLPGHGATGEGKGAGRAQGNLTSSRPYEYGEIPGMCMCVHNAHAQTLSPHVRVFPLMLTCGKAVHMRVCMWCPPCVSA